MTKTIIILIFVLFGELSIAKKIDHPLLDDKERASELSKWHIGAFLNPNISRVQYPDFNNPKYQVSPGFVVGRQIGKTFVLQTGINYLRLNNITRPVFCDPISCPTEGNYKLLEFPLEIKYNFYKGKTGLYLYGQIEFYSTFLVNSQQYFWDNEDEIYETNLFRLTQNSLGLGLGVKYSLSNNFSIYAEPIIKHIFGDYGIIITYAYLRQFGTRLGLIYRINN